VTALLKNEPAAGPGGASSLAACADRETDVGRQAVTRREVLNQSAKLFAAHGYRSTSLQAVSDRLGVTRQALYYHFMSKGEILGALFDELMTKLEAAGDAALRDSAQPWFVSLLRAHIEVCVSNIDLLSLLLHERPEIAKLEGLRADKRRREYTNLFMDAYEKGVAEGRLVDVDRWIAVNTLLSATNGISAWFHGSQAHRSGEQFRTDLTRLLAQGYLIENDSNPAPRIAAAVAD